MREIAAVSASYAPMATACSRLYFALQDLAQIHFLYHFSLQLFLSLFRSVVCPGVSDHDKQKQVGTAEKDKEDGKGDEEVTKQEQ